MQGLTAFERHKRLLREYEAFYGKKSIEQGKGPVSVKTDEDTLKEQYRFIRTEQDDKEGQPWEIALARRYYDKLFKEYAIVDLSQYKEGQIGCRWRTHAEVVAGKGQFTCGSRGCPKTGSLETYEVPFQYAEAGKQRHALVKVRLCPEHAMQLSYKKNKKAFSQQAKKRKHTGSPSTAKGSTDPNMKDLPQSEKKQRLRGDAPPVSSGEEMGNARQGISSSSKHDIEAEVDKFLDDLLL